MITIIKILIAAILMVALVLTAFIMTPIVLAHLARKTFQFNSNHKLKAYVSNIRHVRGRRI